MYANYTRDLTRLTDCCAAYSTIADDGALSCKACWNEVPSGQGDAPGPVDKFINGQIGRPRGKDAAGRRWVQWHRDDNTWVIVSFEGWLIDSETKTNDWDIALKLIRMLAADVTV